MNDLLQDCLDDFHTKVGISRKEQSAKDFQATFCQRCRNPNCVRARWSQDKFGERVSTQGDRLLNPIQADPTLPKYAQITKADFKSCLREAYRLEIADRRGDWEVPEIPIVDGQTYTARLSTTETVDQAVRQLAQAQDREAPTLPEPPDGSDEFARAAEGIMTEVEISKAPPKKPEPESSQPKSKKLKGRLLPKLGNVPVPAEGIMVDGSPPPKSQPAFDPWAPPPTAGLKRVKTGVQIKLDADGNIANDG